MDCKTDQEGILFLVRLAAGNKYFNTAAEGPRRFTRTVSAPALSAREEAMARTRELSVSGLSSPAKVNIVAARFLNLGRAVNAPPFKGVSHSKVAAVAKELDRGRETKVSGDG